MEKCNRKLVDPVYSMCVQPSFIIGTNNEDGSYNFAPITWVSATQGEDEDFATTGSGHVIHLNASYFCNLDLLKKAYSDAVEAGDFVAGTDWRAIGRHETGHVVANTYNIDSLGLIVEILDITSKAELFYRLGKELSIYSAAYSDGREIISESFSGYYSKVGNVIANAFVNRCLALRKAGDQDEGL